MPSEAHRPPDPPTPSGDDALGGAAWLTALGRRSTVAALVAEHDWSSTPLGPVAGWPAALRSAVALCLSSRFPMRVAWGPELVQIYNDGYRDILGAGKHPGALGRGVQEVWPEVWHAIGPLMEQVTTTGEGTWVEHGRYDLERKGFPEECYFTFSYSPIVDDDGSVGGVFTAITETTELVVNRRRLECLGGLAARLVGSEQVADVCAHTVGALATFPTDTPSAEIHVRVGDRYGVIAANRRGPAALVDPDRIAEIADTGRPTLLDPDWVEGQPARCIALPVGHDEARCVLVVGLNRQLPFDRDYRDFLKLVADNVGAALDHAYRRAVELGEQRLISDTLQQAMLKPASDLPTVAARYQPAVGNLSVGGDWYDVVTLEGGRRALVVGDCVGHGLAAATAMGQLRSASRALLLDGSGPAEVLESLDRFAGSVDGAASATVVCAIVDLADGTLTYANAGHPPPLLVTSSGCSTWLEGGRGRPLAVSPGPRVDAQVDLAADDLLVLYTDGLVERRGEDLDVGLARLRALAEERRADTVQRLADTLIEELLAPDARDDVALVVKRVVPPTISGHSPV